MILADKAEVVNGKFYMMGGAWDRRYVTDFSKSAAISIAIGVLVPWNLTNQPHTLGISVEHEDGTSIPPQVQGTVTVGRPPNATSGQTFRAMAIIDGQWTLSGPGTYSIVASLPGANTKKQLC